MPTLRQRPLVCPNARSHTIFRHNNRGHAVKFGVVEAPLRTRFAPMMAAEMGYRTAMGTGADSYWISDHLNGFCPAP